MADLTDAQIAFLRSQYIPLSKVFDASGIAKADYQSAMKELGKCFAYGVSPCGKGGHTLRTRAGHCIQCDHSKIAYMMRHESRAFIYIAASASGRLIKVGSSINVADRHEKLNRYRYGGQNDWQIIATADCATAGKVELETHRRLAQFATEGDYERAGRRQRCYELFRCNFGDAREALEAALGRTGSVSVPDEARALAAFNFR